MSLRLDQPLRYERMTHINEVHDTDGILGELLDLVAQMWEGVLHMLDLFAFIASSVSPAPAFFTSPTR